MARQNYQVLARKWRPQKFDDVVGQAAVVRTLSNALAQGRTAHAYCFSGIRGVGKTTIARLLAKGLNCRTTEAPTAEPCGHCESCEEILASRSLDVFERDAASDRGINEMKELIEIARYAPSRDRYKVMILDEAHMLTPEASNALLKVLEEPPEYIVFVLATTEPNKILPTILSRCQHYQFARISQREIAEHLGRIAAAEGIAITDDGLALLATAADGSLRDAQSLLDKLIAFAGENIDETTVVDLLGLVDRVLLYRATELISAGDVAGVIGFVNEMVEQGIDLHQFAIDLLGHFRNLLVVLTVDDAGEILHLPEADVARLKEQAAHFTVDDLDRAFSLMAANEYRIKVAEQPRYHVEIILARLARMPTLEPIEELLASLRGDPGGKPAAGRTRAVSAATAPAAKPRSTAKTPPTPAAKPKAAPAAAAAVLPAATTPSAPTAAPLQPAPAAEPARQAQRAPTDAHDDEPPLQDEAPADLDARGDAVAQETVAPEAEPAPASSVLGRIQQELTKTHPLVAQVLGRSSGLELAGESITFRFPATAELFVQRVRDPDVGPALAAACEAALGRPVRTRIEIDTRARGTAPTSAKPASAPPTAPAATSPAAPATSPTPAASPGSAAPPGPGPSTAPSPPPAAQPPAPAPADASAQQADGTADSTELRRRADRNPLVQGLLHELKGQVISVEEL